MRIRFRHAAAAPEIPTLAVPVFSGLRQPAGANITLDQGFLAARGFTAKVGETIALLADDGGTIIAVGLGDQEGVEADRLRQAGAAAARAAWHQDALAMTLASAAGPGLRPADAAQAVVEGAALASYRFTTYKSDPKSCRLEDVVLLGGASRAMTTGIERGTAVAQAVWLARDLVNGPPGEVTPARLAAVATSVAKDAGLKVEVWDEKAAARERLGGLLGVAAGSAVPPRLIRLTYEPKARARGSVALVGKGITFDSGGLNIKSFVGMVTMKTDMAGGAAVIAAMSALPALAAPVRVIAYVPATENLPSGTATKPGDVLRARNGKTIEVLNTDAEGRLVLADGLSLAVEAGVDAIVDLATLTGAATQALGRKIAPMMGTSPGLLDQLRAAAERSGERVWELPLFAGYRKHIDSEIADIKNTGVANNNGTITGGLFLREFVGNVPWAHLDIAGTARSEEDDGFISRGGTGFGVRLLLEWLRDFRRPASE
jgi:leucyl aminopeptidase